MLGSITKRMAMLIPLLENHFDEGDYKVVVLASLGREGYRWYRGLEVQKYDHTPGDHSSCRGKITCVPSVARQQINIIRFVLVDWEGNGLMSHSNSVCLWAGDTLKFDWAIEAAGSPY